MPLIAALLFATMSVGCESQPEPAVQPVTRGGTTGAAKTKETDKHQAGSSRTSRPLNAGSTKSTQDKQAPGKPAKPAPTAQSKSVGKSKAEPAAEQQAKRAEKGAAIPPPAYAEIAKAYNARASRLQRVWARAVVSVDFTDEEGERRWEQGEGHFQVIQPSKMALSAGKLGEVMLWIGCDADRYWFIDAKEKHRGWVGKHSAASREKTESLGMPAAPRDLLALAGITPLPKPAADKRRDPAVRWSADRRALIFDSVRAGTRWRYMIDPKTYEPQRIEVVDAASSEPILSATLENYDNVKIRGEGAVPPRIATRFRCLHHPSGSTLGLSISDMSDGGSNRLREQNFDYDALTELLGIRDTVDLDARRSTPGAGSAATGE